MSQPNASTYIRHKPWAFVTNGKDRSLTFSSKISIVFHYLACLERRPGVVAVGQRKDAYGVPIDFVRGEFEEAAPSPFSSSLKIS
jgi:hypothetical protein